MLTLKRPLVVLDFEGTGTDPFHDRAVSLGMVTMGDADWNEYYQLFNPGIPIPPETTEVHGITDEMVKDKPRFEDCAADIMQRIGDADLSGFNLIRYDVPMLVEELGRAGYRFDWQNRCIIDAGNIFKKMEERTLSAAVEFYLKKKHEGDHNALGDSRATLNVFQAQLERYKEKLGEHTVEQLAEFSHFEKTLDLAGKIGLDEEGEPIYLIGEKTKGKRVKDEPSMAEWMLRKDFPECTKEVLRGILREMQTENQHELF